MKIKLTEAEKLELESRHRSERDKNICDRIKAVLLRSEDWSLQRIAQALRLHKDTVRRHLETYEEEARLSPQNGGSKGKLSDSQSEELIAHLEDELYQRVIDICAHVQTTYAVTYTVSGMTWWLKQHQFSYKKPKEVPAKADEVKQRNFIGQYQTLKTETPENEPIIFMDSAHPTMETKASYGWIRKGKEKPLFSTASRTRINLTGAVHLATMQVTHASYETINAETTIDFLKKLKDEHPHAPQLHVILDCSGYHRSEAVQKYAENNQIKLHYLPPYSPNLNPTERLWKLMNEYARNNKFFATAKEFRASIFGFFTDTIPRIASSLKSRINDNFHIVKAATSV